ncbi:MAG: ParB/RepB/Spo0J family partition protein [Gammaproteobacteria bacterium]|nr:ParB/RepB/Spo0J family partition protein [Gammaproteobacteria bacterium]
MTKKKPRLGRGLGALLGDVTATMRTHPETSGHGKPGTALPAEADAEPDRTGFHDIPIERLQRGAYQPRTRIDEEALNELAESIRSQGIIQPLLVRPAGKNRFEIIAGERRWRGAQLAGMTTVPAVVREIPDHTAAAVGLIENMQREDLNAMEEARGYQRLLDEFGFTHQEVSEVVGYSRTAVSNLLRLLSLHPAVQKMVENGEIDMGHARALLGLPENLQPEIALKIHGKGLSVRQAERLVKALGRNRPDEKTDHPHQGNADIVHLEEDLSKRIGAKVKIEHGSKKGRLIIHYHTLDELDGILERIN